MGGARAGTVAALWRYPVKSMGGERCERLELDARGVRGDRLFAIRNPEGKFGSGKSTRRFRKIDGLLRFDAVYAGDTPAITFPDGRRLAGDDPAIHDALSHALGQPVTLAREADISHLDAAPVHLVTTAAMRWLGSTLPASSIDTRRFRPNLVIDAPGDTQVERDWIGAVLRIGATTLRVLEPTERCVMVGMPQATLSDDPEILSTLGRQAGAEFGVYAAVVAAGTVARHDAVVIER
ncbi:MAG TPA: MOSC N-terminal beta barrel domain-containing protein [Terriglobales bacterium]|nr:MOSC N-terminal beta barrel domain-containing protein [Terriglobales bacterium]